jgi:hypothetical protein
VLDDCGKWRIKRKFLIIESYPKDTLLESRFLNDTCITIINTEGNIADVLIYKDGKMQLNRFDESGLIEISKKQVDYIEIANLSEVRIIYNRIGEHDYYKFSFFGRCLPDRTQYKYRISANYTLKGVLSGKKVKLIKNSNVPDIGRKF